MVVVVVAVLVIVKLAGSDKTPTGVATRWTPLPSSIAQDLAAVPSSVYDKVGVGSPAVPVSKPVIVTGTPALTFNGKPGIFYLGGEFCPYCAAERWALTAAVSRFGTLSGLGEMQSASTDVDPNTQTVTYYKASLASPYVSLRTVEHYSDVVDRATGYWATLQPLTSADRQLLNTYYQPKYLPGVTPGQVTLPFIDIGNAAFVPSASFSPTILAGLTRQEIARGLSDPTNPVTRAILATANYLSASICAVDGQQPTSVCASAGVTEAANALHLSHQ